VHSDVRHSQSEGMHVLDPGWLTRTV
jgi:hypothetical protein